MEKQEILFRGLSLKTREWVFGYYAFFPEYKGPGTVNRDPGRHIIATKKERAVDVCHETVTQYTGLKDSQGRMIFKGDIVEASIYADEKPSILEVYWSKGCYVIDYEDSESDYIPIGWFTGEIKVVGNIFENSELLTERKND